MTRLLSLDVFRGITMLLLVSHGFGIYDAYRNPQFEHAEWVGCTLWDLIQPAFTFIVGVAMPIAFRNRKGDVFRHVLWRTFALIVLSNLLSNFGKSPDSPLKLQFINVLCQIAFSYLMCFGILQLPFRLQMVVATLILIVHNGLFFWTAGGFDPVANYAAAVDRAVLGYNYSGHYTTLNFLGNGITVLFGCWTGLLLQNVPEDGKRLRILAISSAACFGLGFSLAPWIPMVKRLWTASFTFFSAGWVLLFFAVCYWLVEVLNWRGRWTFVASVIGANSIFIYSFSQVLSGWLSRGLANFDGNKFAFLGPPGAIPHYLLVMLVMWSLCYWLYQRKIFFKI
ncbi:DUF5009 domain-containing protein [Bryobacterales bacterium F-183]|nr:DUF5009 domain-containing protein [Bryobacterales bacterium F-183]